MGTYLGHHRDTHLLGDMDDVWSTIGQITTLGPIGSGIKRLFGGSDCSAQQIEKKQQVAHAINELLSYQDRVRLVRGTESDISPTPESMAEFYGGGRDCKHKNVTPGDQRFLDELPRLVEQRALEREEENARQEQESKQKEEQASSEPDEQDQQTPAESDPAGPDALSTYLIYGGMAGAGLLTLLLITNR